MIKDENIGKIIGIYTILDVYDQRCKDGHLLYQCQCNICHKVLIKKLFNIKHVTCCKHMNIHWINKRIGKIFKHMAQRCYNVNYKDYRWYGAKGIKICDEWLNNPNQFEDWAIQNGYEDHLTIDRIDANKNYSPDNCQWISLEDNSRKAGKVTWITVEAKTLTGRQWADKLQIGTNTINSFVRQYGINKTKELIEAMLKEPPPTKYRKSHQSWFSVYGIET